MSPDRGRREEDRQLIKQHHILVSLIGLFIAATAYVFTTFPTKEFVRDGDLKNERMTESIFRELKEQNARIESDMRDTKNMMITFIRERKN